MSTKNDIGPDLLKMQADLRENGLLADVHEKWMHPNGHLWLDATPRVFEVERRQRSDRLTNADAQRIGIDRKPKRGRGKRR